VFCQLLSFLSLIGWAMFSEMSEILDKPANYIKLGQTPLLSFTPDSGSEVLKDICQTKQAKLATYVSVPYRSKLPLPAHGKPFIQIINIHDTSILFFRKQSGFDVSTLILSRLPMMKRKRLYIHKLLRAVPDDALNFMVDLHKMKMSHTFPIYVMIATNEMLKITVDKEMKKKKLEKLILPDIKDPKRVIVYKSAIYVLEYNKVTKILPDRKSFSKAKVQKVDLKREYSDMAIVNGTFVFMRGFTTLVFSNSFNPESKSAYSPSLRVHHGRFKFAGFDHFVLYASVKEGSEMRYFYFIRPQGRNQTDLKSIQVQMLQKRAPGHGPIVRLLHFKHAMYFIYKKAVSIQYLNSTADMIVVHKTFPGTMHGIVGHYNRLEESLHPLVGIKLHVKNKLRLRKLYLNCLHSELICKQPPNLNPGEKKTLYARILTRKNDLHMRLDFIGTKPYNSTLIPAEPIHINGSLHNTSKQPKPPLKDQNNQNATYPTLVHNATDSALHPSKNTTKTPSTKPTPKPATSHTTTKPTNNKPANSSQTGSHNHTAHHDPFSNPHNGSSGTRLSSGHGNHTVKNTRHGVNTSNHTGGHKTVTSKPDDDDDKDIRSIKHWIHYAILICLILVMVVLCLVRMALKRQIRGMENAEDIMRGSVPNGDPADSRGNELSEVFRTEESQEVPNETQQKQSKEPKLADNELSYQVEQSVSNAMNESSIYRQEKPADDSELDNEEPPMPDMTL